MFFKLLKDALKVKLLRSKILYTIFIIFVLGGGTHNKVTVVNAMILDALST
ncbi:preprotein translocase subunit SecY, partial [Streptococcus suis]